MYLVEPAPILLYYSFSTRTHCPCLLLSSLVERCRAGSTWTISWCMRYRRPSFNDCCQCEKRDGSRGILWYQLWDQGISLPCWLLVLFYPWGLHLPCIYFTCWCIVSFAFAEVATTSGSRCKRNWRLLLSFCIVNEVVFLDGSIVFVVHKSHSWHISYRISVG